MAPLAWRHATSMRAQHICHPPWLGFSHLAPRSIVDVARGHILAIRIVNHDILGITSKATNCFPLFDVVAQALTRPLGTC